MAQPLRSLFGRTVSKILRWVLAPPKPDLFHSKPGGFATSLRFAACIPFVKSRGVLAKTAFIVFLSLSF